MSTLTPTAAAARPRPPAALGAAANLAQTLPLRLLGAFLLVGALDPARWPDYPCPQWFFGAVAFGAGAWAGAPVLERPVLHSYRWQHRLPRHRNTLLAAASAFLAAFQSPPVWLMAVETLLLLTFLMLVDAGTVAARGGRAQLNQALCAGGAAALVLLSAVAPITGGWWARSVAALAVLGALGLVYPALRLRRPAGHPRHEAALPGRDQSAEARRH